MHYSVPVLGVVGYLLFGPRPRFDLNTLWWSLTIPLVYMAYTLIRSPFINYTEDGETRDRYPYHFIDVNDIGYGTALLNIAGIFLLLTAVGWLFIVLDRRLPPRPSNIRGRG